MKAALCAAEREQAARSAAVRSAEAAERAAREAAEAARLLDVATRCGMVCSGAANVPQTGLRVQDFKRATVQVTVVRHGAEGGAPVPGSAGLVSNARGLLSNTVDSAGAERARSATAAAVSAAASAAAAEQAEIRGSKAASLEKDRRAAAATVAELARLGAVEGLERSKEGCSLISLVRLRSHYISL